MQAGPEATYMLNGGTLATTGAIIGALCGAIVFLTRKLIDTKDGVIESRNAEIKRLEIQLDLLQRQRALEAEMMRAERDYFREIALKPEAGKSDGT